MLLSVVPLFCFRGQANNAKAPLIGPKPVAIKCHNL